MLSFLKKCGLLLLFVTVFVALLVFFEPVFMGLFSKNRSSSIKVYREPQQTYIGEKIEKEKPLQSSISEKEKPLQSSISEKKKPTDKVVSIQEGPNSLPTPIQTTTQNDKGDTKPLMKRPPKEGITKAVAWDIRSQEIESEMRALAPHTGKGNHAITLRMLDLEEEMLTIQQEQGLLHTHGGNPFNEIKMMRLVFSSLTDGKVPVSIGEQIATYLEEDGQHEAAAMYRVVTQRAIENGDEFYKPEHLEDN